MSNYKRLLGELYNKFSKEFGNPIATYLELHFELISREMNFCMSYWGDTTDDYNTFCLYSAKPVGPSIEQILAANG